MSDPPQFAGMMSPPPPEGRPPRLMAPSERLACAVTHPAPDTVGQAVPPAVGTMATVALASDGSAPTEATVKLGAPFGSWRVTLPALPVAWRLPQVHGRKFGATPAIVRLAASLQLGL